MTTTANEIFRQLVQTLYSSNLHFHLSETPFSAQILIRKKFLKDRITDPSSTSSFSQTETAQNQIRELQKNNEISSNTINRLEQKLEHAESKASKASDEKKIEIETLKSSLKNSGLEVKNLKKDLESERKVVNQKEKYIQKLENKCENLATNNKEVKTEMTKLKNQNKKLLKIKSNIPDSIDPNQNLQPAASSQTCLSTGTAPNTQPGAQLRTQPGTPPPARHGTTLETPLSTPAESLTSPKPSTTTLFGTSSGLASCGTPPASLPCTPPPCAPPDTVCTPATVSSESNMTCHHTPQCVTRQPRPPPSDKCAILVHEGSRYHEHMASERGVPARYSTCEYCMRIDWKNYGCEDCIWFKWWGELHGYPDINPWSFKEHLQPVAHL